MRIAIPLEKGKLAEHFGHCEQFALIDVDPDNKNSIKIQKTEAPPHQPGLLPQWLAKRGADVIISGGMGTRAQHLFSKQNIQVILGASAREPKALAQEYLSGVLKTGQNLCDH